VYLDVCTSQQHTSQQVIDTSEKWLLVSNSHVGVVGLDYFDRYGVSRGGIPGGLRVLYSYSRELFVRLNKTPWRDRLLRLQIGKLILPNSVQDYGKALITIVVTSASEM
jgi:hypothetical protein